MRPAATPYFQNLSDANFAEKSDKFHRAQCAVVTVLFWINGAKMRAPAAALALQERLR